MLIIGGLIAIGLIALVAAGFLLRSGREDKRKRDSGKQKAVQATPQNLPSTVHSVEPSPLAVPTMASAKQPIEEAKTTIIPTAQLETLHPETEYARALQHQMQELTSQLLSLQQQADGIERRLQHADKLLNSAR